jgi:hypothetical protein
MSTHLLTPDLRNVAHVAVADATCRASISDALHRRGWTVVEQPTGFHLLQAIADVIDRPPGNAVKMPRLLVVDAIARGCAGVTIAAGLRELGVRIPLVLVARAGDPLPVSDDGEIRVAGPDHAPAIVAALAGELATEKVAAETVGELHAS